MTSRLRGVAGLHIHPLLSQELRNLLLNDFHLEQIHLQALPPVPSCWLPQTHTLLAVTTGMCVYIDSALQNATTLDSFYYEVNGSL